MCAREGKNGRKARSIVVAAGVYTDAWPSDVSPTRMDRIRGAYADASRDLSLSLIFGGISCCCCSCLQNQTEPTIANEEK